MTCKRPADRAKLSAMQRAEIKELHYICLLQNAPSILNYGILCHNESLKLPNVNHSLAENSVQQWREKKRLPHGKALHDYANLYFDARNAMMFQRIYPLKNSGRAGLLDSLCVYRVDPTILDEPDVWVTDIGAGGSTVGFYLVHEGLPRLKADRVYADSWNVGDPAEQEQRKKERMAEVLVPSSVPPKFFLGVAGLC